MTTEDDAHRFRTLFISDVHLGARGSQAERLLDFLRWHWPALLFGGLLYGCVDRPIDRFRQRRLRLAAVTGPTP